MAAKNEDNQQHPGSSCSEPRLFRRSTILVKKGSRKSAGNTLGLGITPMTGGTLAMTTCASPTSVTAVTTTIFDESLMNDDGNGRKQSMDQESGASGASDKEDSERKHRLQRQKAQSRKTFLLRKSRKGHLPRTQAANEQLGNDVDIVSPTMSENENTLSANETTSATKLNANLLDLSSANNINDENGNSTELNVADQRKQPTDQVPTAAESP